MNGWIRIIEAGEVGEGGGLAGDLAVGLDNGPAAHTGLNTHIHTYTHTHTDTNTNTLTSDSYSTKSDQLYKIRVAITVYTVSCINI